MQKSPDYRALFSSPEWQALWEEGSRVREEARRLEQIALQTDPARRDDAYEAACRLAGVYMVKAIVEKMAEAESEADAQQVVPIQRESRLVGLRNRATPRLR